VTSRSVRNSLGRSRALIVMTSLFIVCWYPLYTLTLVDPKFEQPTKLYKVIGASNGGIILLTGHCIIR